MQFFSRHSDRQIDGALAGKTNGADGELEAVAAFFSRMKVELTEPPTAASETAHLNQIFAAAREQRPAMLPEWGSNPKPLRGSKRFSSRTARAMSVAIGVAALGGFGGAAYAGILPATVQTKVSDIAHHVGVSLPRNDGHNHHPDRGTGQGDVQPAQTTPSGVDAPGKQDSGGSGGSAPDNSQQQDNSDEQGNSQPQDNSQQQDNSDKEGNSPPRSHPQPQRDSGQESPGTQRTGDGTPASSGGATDTNPGDAGPSGDPVQQSTTDGSSSGDGNPGDSQGQASSNG